MAMTYSTAQLLLLKTFLTSNKNTCPAVTIISLFPSSSNKNKWHYWYFKFQMRIGMYYYPKDPYKLYKWKLSLKLTGYKHEECYMNLPSGYAQEKGYRSGWDTSLINKDMKSLWYLSFSVGHSISASLSFSLAICEIDKDGNTMYVLMKRHT